MEDDELTTLSDDEIETGDEADGWASTEADADEQDADADDADQDADADDPSV